MEYKEENILKPLAIALLAYAAICLVLLASTPQYSPMDLETYFRLRYGY